MPPPEFTIFLDENHHRTPAILAVLRDLSVPFECYHQHFPPSIADDVWLPVIGRRGWVLLTSDQRIRVNHSEVTQVIETGVRLFCFSSNNQPGAALATALQRALPEIMRLIEEVPPPFFATIEKSGKVHLRALGSGRTAHTPSR